MDSSCLSEGHAGTTAEIVEGVGDLRDSLDEKRGRMPIANFDFQLIKIYVI